MKKLVIMLIALFTITVSANAMSYEQARQQALFLTDKMAYELDLTEEQYEAAYEINLDYLMSVNSHDDLYGAYWTHRNLDMSYILLDWQYNAFCAASYFYRPLYWADGFWHFGIYARYPHRTYLYFGRPSFWVSYRGGHSWHHNGGRSWYHGRSIAPHHKPSRDHHVGMRSTHRNDNHGSHSFNRDRNRNNDTYRHSGNIESRNNGNHGLNRDRNRNNIDNNGINRNGNRPQGNDTYQRGENRGNNSHSFGTRESSTRTTVTSPGTSERSTRGFGAGSRSGSNTSATTPSRSFRPSGNSSSRSFGSSSNSSSRNFGSSSGSRSFGSSSSGSRSFGSSSSGSRSFGGSSSGSRSFGGGSRSGGSSGGGHGHFGGRR